MMIITAADESDINSVSISSGNPGNVLFPEVVVVEVDVVVVGSAIWTATIRDELVTEWKIYEDTPENRKRLGVE